MPNSDEPDYGWGLMPNQMLGWVVESGILSDAWQALEMSADVRSYKDEVWRVDVRLSPFATPKGRAFLLTKLTDEQQPFIARRTAAEQLSQALSPFPAHDRSHPNLAIPTLDEQESVIRAVAPLASSKDRRLRREVIILLLRASDPFNDAAWPQRTKLAIPTVSKALLAETDADILRNTALTLNHLMDEDEWRKLTGNPSKICVSPILRVYNGFAEFNVVSQHLPVGAALPVRCIMERRDGNGKVLERSERKLSSSNGQSWPEEWHGFMQLEKFDTRMMTPGRWWAWLEGVTADAAHLPWKSWHVCLDIR